MECKIIEPKENWCISKNLIKKLKLKSFKPEGCGWHFGFVLQGEDGKSYELEHILMSFLQEVENKIF